MLEVVFHALNLGGAGAGRPGHVAPGGNSPRRAGGRRGMPIALPNWESSWLAKTRLWPRHPRTSTGWPRHDLSATPGE